MASNWWDAVLSVLHCGAVRIWDGTIRITFSVLLRYHSVSLYNNKFFIILDRFWPTIAIVINTMLYSWYYLLMALPTYTLDPQCFSFLHLPLKKLEWPNLNHTKHWNYGYYKTLQGSCWGECVFTLTHRENCDAGLLGSMFKGPHVLHTIII